MTPTASFFQRIGSNAGAIRGRIFGASADRGSSSGGYTNISSRQEKDSEDLAQEVLADRNRSQEWLKANFWEQWTIAYQNYKCEEEPQLDPNDPTQIDETQTAVGMPDTWGITRRFVARVTAQPPSHRFIASDTAVADRITRGLMWQWDRGGPAAIEKKHVTQSSIFGLSVRPWYWSKQMAKRKRRINPLAPPDPEIGMKLVEQYSDRFSQYLLDLGLDAQSLDFLDPNSRLQVSQQLTARLIGDVGRGNLVPVEYMYKHYEGPKCDFLFIGDTYLPPNYQGLAADPRGIIIERRRNKKYFMDLLALYSPKVNPTADAEVHEKLRKGVRLLFEAYPNGSPSTSTVGKLGTSNLRDQLLAAVDRTDSILSSSTAEEALEWVVTERHVPGDDAHLDLVAEGVWLGRFPYPYDLEGKIAFTELLFIDDLLTGVGDSVPRIIRGINKLHNRQVGQREDLVDALLKPLMSTTDRQVYDNPDLLKRHKAMRLVLLRGGPGALQVLGEQAALASANASLADEGALARQLQAASGESNLSMAADVDPQQARTATGAKIQARAADILTKDAVAMYTLSKRDDLEMMRLLNRSELSEPITINSNQYRRRYGQQPQDEVQQEEEQISASPEDFQYDGEIEVEVGSTLADDDDTKRSRAQELFQISMGSPQLFNTQQAAIELLTAYNKGNQLQKWLAPPQPAPKELPRQSGTVSVPLEKQSPEVQALLLEKVFDITEETIRGKQQGGGGTVPDLAQQEGSTQPNGALPGASGIVQMPQIAAAAMQGGAQAAEENISPNGLSLDQQGGNTLAGGL